jgi:hypothetical protein
LIGKLKQGGVFASVLGAPASAAEYPSIAVKTMQVKADPHAAAEKSGAGKILLVA